MTNPDHQSLVWNHADGMRVIPSLGESHAFHPGLNLVSVAKWNAMRPQVEPWIKAGDVEPLGEDLGAMDPLVLIAAIQDTTQKHWTFRTRPGIEALRWIEKHETRLKVLEAVREVLAAAGPPR